MTVRTYQFQAQALVTLSAGSIISKSATSALNIQSEALPGPLFTFNEESELTLTSDSVYEVLSGGVIFIEQELNLVSTAHAQGYETVESVLDIQQEAIGQAPIALDRLSNLNLQQEATYSHDQNVSAETVLGITQTAARTYEVSASTVLAIVSEGCRIFTGEHDLNLTSEAEWGYGYDAESEVEIVDLAERILGLNRGLSHENIISQSAAYFIENPCNKKQFNTFDGAGAVPGASKKLNYSNTFLMMSLDDGTILELRNPETDDARRYAFNRVNRTYFDGTADVFVDDSWVTEQTQLYTIVALKRTKLDELFTFLQDNLGREVLIKDWKGVSWIVVITNPGDLYTEDGEGYWTANFEVVGEAVDGEYIVQHLGLTEDLSRAGSIWLRSGSSTDIVSDQANREIELAPSSALTLGNVATFTIV